MGGYLDANGWIISSTHKTITTFSCRENINLMRTSCNVKVFVRFSRVLIFFLNFFLLESQPFESREKARIQELQNLATPQQFRSPTLPHLVRLKLIFHRDKISTVPYNLLLNNNPLN